MDGPAGACPARPHVAHPCRRGREPEPCGRERGPARHRTGVRLLPDDTQPDRGGLLARARSVGAVAGRTRRSVWAQDDARPRRVAFGSGLSSRGVRAVRRGALRRSCSGGIAAGMAYPTTLALITALWSGQPRTRSIALWSATGGAIASLGPLIAGALLEHFWWGSVFLVTLPLAAVALVLAVLLVPSHVNEETEPVDNLGGILSALLVGGLILAIDFAPVPGEGMLVIGLGAIARRGRDRLRDPTAASQEPALRPPRRGPSNVLGRRLRRHHRVRFAHGRDVHRPAVPPERARSTRPFDAGARDPSRRDHDGPHRAQSAQLVASRGSRFTLLAGYLFCFLGFLTMLLLWKEDISYWKVGLGYAFIGIGVGFAGTPASHSLTGSVPVPTRRHGFGHRRSPTGSRWCDHAVDLRGAAHRGLRVGRSDTIAASPNASDVTDTTQSALTKSFSSAANLASDYPPQTANAIIAGARRRSSTARTGRTSPDSSPSSWAPRSCSSCSRGRSARRHSSPSTTSRTPRRGQPTA